tara:strand:- start:181 stop:951 length:771 start_codon:yes stop_codon:yes gene_type:complete
LEIFILTIKDFIYLITIKTLIVAAAAVGATIYCIENEFVTEIPISLIGLAVVFPLVFTIGTAFQRRDLALKEYGAINSNLASIFFTAKNWQLEDKGNSCDLDNLKKTIDTLFDLIKKDMKDQKSTNLRKAEIYFNFEELFKLTSKIRPDSSVVFFFANLMSSYETLNSLSEYRTPRGLKAYSNVFLAIFPILFSPYFASLSGEFYSVGLVVAFVYSLVLVMLSNIQDNLENPFDMQGLDDLDMDNLNRAAYFTKLK